MQQARRLNAVNHHVLPAEKSKNVAVRSQPERQVYKIKLLMILATCFLLCLVVVAQYSSLVILNYRLSSSRTELAKIEESLRIAELEKASLSSIGRIERIAVIELGMVEPEIVQLKVLSARQGETKRLGE